MVTVCKSRAETRDARIELCFIMARLEVIAATIFFVHITMIQTQFKSDLISKCNQGEVVCTGSKNMSGNQTAREHVMTWDPYCFPTESNVSDCDSMIIGVREGDRIIWTVFYHTPERDLSSIGFFVILKEEAIVFQWKINQSTYRQENKNFFPLEISPEYKISPNKYYSFWSRPVLDYKDDKSDLIIDLEADPVKLGVGYFVITQNTNKSTIYRRWRSRDYRKLFKVNQRPRPVVTTPGPEKDKEEKIWTTGVLAAIVILSTAILITIGCLIWCCLKSHKDTDDMTTVLPDKTTTKKTKDPFGSTVKTVDSNVSKMPNKDYSVTDTTSVTNMTKVPKVSFKTVKTVDSNI